jgi:hypothetical protein
MRSRSVSDLQDTPASLDPNSLASSPDFAIDSGFRGEVPHHQETQAAIPLDLQAADLPAPDLQATDLQVADSQVAMSEDGSANLGEDLSPSSSLALLDDQAVAEHSATDSALASITDANLGSGSINLIGTLIQEINGGTSGAGLHIAPLVDSGFTVTTDALFGPASAPTPLVSINLAPPPFGGHGAEAVIGVDPVETAIAHPAFHAILDASLNAGSPATSTLDLAYLENSGAGSPVTNSAVGSGGATAAQVQEALDESGLSVNGSGIKVGVLSDSFNDLGGAAADEADGALPPASDIQVLSDLSSGGTDEGRAMMQIIHDIAPGASLAFYTSDNSEQDFANGILALAAAGAKVIVDDVSYYDEPYFQNDAVAQAIQTVEAEGVTYVTAGGNNASNAYQAAWTPSSGSYGGTALNDAESFGGSLVQSITVTASSTEPVPLLLEWNQAYGHNASNIEVLIFQNGSLVGTVTNQQEDSSNPWLGIAFTTSGTYQIAIENLSGPNPGLIKEILAGDGLSETISGANAGTVFGHAMTPGAITTGAVSAADTPAFGYSPSSEYFSSSGAGTELLFANDGTALSSPDELSPVAVSGVDDIATTLPGGLSDFYGTSAAAASLAGVAALILSADPNLTPTQVEQLMEQTATPMSNSVVSGAGLVNVDAAVAAAEALYTRVIQTDGATSLVQTGTDYFLDTVGGNSAGPELKSNGSPITSADNWIPIGAVKVSGGYDVAWKMSGANEYSIWSTDSNGNYLASLVPAVSGNSAALESYETIFNQDLNRDGTIGLTTVVIQVDGSTSLTEVANTFDLYTNGTGPSLKYGGTTITGGEFAGWTPIGAVQTANGYDVAWKMSGANEYSIWSTDSNGNYLANLIPAVSGSSITLESYETLFNQDLNGDHTIGISATVIQTDGSTSLEQAGANYFLHTVGSSSIGPELMSNGTPVTAGAWTPIGAVQVSGGYDVAWKMSGANEYSIWSTDSNGNYLANLTPAVSGSSITLESYETLFNQDLNGDHTTGISATVIQTDGTTSLEHVGANYFLHTVGSSSIGPELMSNGTPVTAGVWIPIGAVQVSGGYDVAWKMSGANEYSIWSTDSNGNYLSNLVPAVSGNSAALESYETSFHQDLNGDGTIGVPAQSSSFSLQHKGFDYVAFYNDGYGNSDSLPSLAQTGANTIEATQPAAGFSRDNFHFSSGDSGATGQTPASNSAAASATHHSFIFAPDHEPASTTNLVPLTSHTPFSETASASVHAAWTATHEGESGNAMPDAAAHAAQWLAHHNDFHLL